MASEHTDDNVLLQQIVAHCLSIDEQAVAVYQCLSSFQQDDELKGFWGKMAAEEREHVLYWQELADMARTNTLPQVFNDPVQVRDELSAIVGRSEELLKRVERNPSVQESFVLAFSLEFYALHPAFASLFCMLEHVPGRTTPAEQYHEHIDKLLGGMIRYAEATAELELVYKSLKSLWGYTRELATQSTVDALAKTLNRRGLFDTIGLLARVAKRNAATVAVMMIDIDDFKRVNDTYGHQVGDHVLAEIAASIMRCTRASDVVGRYGGDEFLVFLSPVESSALDDLAEKIQRSVVTAMRGRIPVTVSVGVAAGRITGDVDTGLAQIIRRADEALYASKTVGEARGTVTTFDLDRTWGNAAVDETLLHPDEAG